MSSASGINCLIWWKAKWKTAFALPSAAKRSAWTAANAERSGFVDMPQRLRRKAGQNRPGVIAFKVQGLRSSETPPKKTVTSKSKSKSKPLSPNHRTQGRSAVAFFGASPVVASALDIRAGATLTDEDNATPNRRAYALRLLSHLTQRPKFGLP